MQIIKNLILALSFCLILFSCNSKKDDAILATAFDYTLYQSDIKGIVPEGSSKADSISIIKNYINNWIKQKIVLHKAEKNLNSDQKDFTQQLEDYKNSLIIYSYETKLINQLLDTNISNEEIEKYYNENSENFLLKDNIIKVNYVKLEINSPMKAKFKNLVLSKKDDNGDKNQLVDLCTKYAVNFYLDDDAWLLFDDLLKEIPIETYDQEAYLKSNRTIETKDENFYYLINIKDFKIRESTSPISFEKDNIKNIIINKRKLELVQNMHKEAFDQAVKNNDFKIY
jgi:hypothetical protein